jgi:hypothetical protein
MKKIIYLILIILMLPLSYALDECKPIAEPVDIPCQVTSTWSYANCTNTTVTIYDSYGTYIENKTFNDFGNTTLCYFNFNISNVGSYTFTISNGDEGNILVENENMILALIIGIGIICALLLWLSVTLENKHFILKLMIYFTVIILCSLIPSAFLINNTALILHKFYLRFQIIFWMYVITFFIYYVLVWFGLIIPKERQGGNN